MRILVVLLTILLVSCATPKTQPNSFYSGVYVPGNVVIENGGAYRSTASVFAKKDVAVARKAAYARLLLEAKAAGYAYFTIADVDRRSVIGTRITIAGKLFRKAASDAAVYPIDAIKRLLKGLPIRTLKEIAAERRRKQAAEAARKRAAAKKQAARRQSAKRASTAAAPLPTSHHPGTVSPSARTPQTEEGGPIIIMAPQDITGSIGKAKRRQQLARGAVSGSDSGAARMPQSSGQVPAGRPLGVSGIPSGVYLLRN